MDWGDGSMGSQIDVHNIRKDLCLDLYLPHESLAWQPAPVTPDEDGKEVWAGGDWKIPGTFWPASLAKMVIPRLSERFGLKN